MITRGGQDGFRDAPAGGRSLRLGAGVVGLAVKQTKEPVLANLEFDAGQYGFAGREIRVRRIAAAGVGETFTSTPAIERNVTLRWNLILPGPGK